MPTIITSGGTLRDAIELIVWALYAGFVIAAASAMFQRRVPGSVVRALDKAEAWTPDSAKTLAELGIKPTFFIRRSLRPGTAVRHHVRAVSDEDARRELPLAGFSGFCRRLFSLGKKTVYDYDFAAQRWYLPDEERYKATSRFSAKGCNWQMLVISAVMFLAVAALLLWTLPIIADKLAEAIASF